jgi:hypothetical protein
MKRYNLGVGRPMPRSKQAEYLPTQCRQTFYSQDARVEHGAMTPDDVLAELPHISVPEHEAESLAPLPKLDSRSLDSA